MSKIKKVSASRLPTQFGEFNIVIYQNEATGIEHVALVKGDIAQQDHVLVRVHSECLTGDIFSSARCDCGEQLHQSQQLISDSGCGAVIYLRDHEGRGIGLSNKIHAYALQDNGLDTVEANIALGLPVDTRNFADAAEILNDLGMKSIVLLSNNPRKSEALVQLGISISEVRSLRTLPNPDNQKYLETKQYKMGHLF